MEREIRIRKVSVAAILQTMNDLYHKGVDFVDIHGVMEDGQDTLGFSFSRFYMNPDFVQNFDTWTQNQIPSKIDVKLSDEDINDLI